MRSRDLRFFTAGAVAAGTSALVYAAYRRDVEAARERIRAQRRFIDSPDGPIEYAEAGEGAPVLVVHGAGGGFDQGLDLGASFLGDGYRVIAPSRFGYLGTPLPVDASPEAQADAHLRLLDALELDKVAVLGVSAGAPSAMQLCLRHPERCSALVLIVPMPWAPKQETTDARLSPLFLAVMNALLSSDFLCWAATKLAPLTLVKSILGTPVEVYRNAPIEERRRVDAMLQAILPVGRRVHGLMNEGKVAANLTRYRFEGMHVPTLVISAADDLYDTYENGLETADRIHDGKFVGFQTGGHLLLGHETAVRSEISKFLKQHVSAKTRALAM